MKIRLTRQRDLRIKYTSFRIYGHPFLKFFSLMYFFVHSAAVCPSVCDCKWKDGKESVLCIDSNLTSIPEKLDTAVLVFQFIGNSLLNLRDDVFQSAGLSNLQKLHLIKCNIKYIEPNAFRMLKNLVELDLSNNAISIIPSRAFVPIPDLRELKLNYNPILKIGDYAFTNVQQLFRLEVSNCRIGYIDENAFTGLESTLRWLKLNKNRIRNIKPETFTTLKTLNGLDLSENPLNCTCDLGPLRDWMSLKSMSTSSLPVCHFPEFNMNKSWDKLQSEDFACLPSVHTPVKIINAYEGENVTLVCRFGGNPTPEVKWTLRNRVLSNSTFGYPVSKKRPDLINVISNNFSNLTIVSLENQDSGEYICLAENKAGKVITDIVLNIEKAPLGTILSEKVVLIGILLMTVIISFMCSVILFVRVMYCKHETSADIESKRRIITEKIEMKRNLSNIKRASSMLENTNLSSQKKIYKDVIDNNNGDNHLHTVLEDHENKPLRPTNFNAIKMKSDSTEQSDLSSSIFESHIGEIALQHHVLHKKELPTGKLYTTAMAFMTDDLFENDENGVNNELPDLQKKSHNSVPGNSSSVNRLKKQVLVNTKGSESQSSLLRNRYGDSSSESITSNDERIRRYEYEIQQRNLRKGISTNGAIKSSSSVTRQKHYPDRSWSMNDDKFSTFSHYSSHKKSPTFDRFNRKYIEKSNTSNNFYNNPHQRMCSSKLPSVSATSYEYHVTQLERFLDEYRRLYLELSKMKETCEKFNKEEELNDYLYGKNRARHNCRLKTASPNNRRYGSKSFERRFNSMKSFRHNLPIKNHSSNNHLLSKSSSFERSVSFVPTGKYGTGKVASSEDVIYPKSILKKKNEDYFRSCDVSMPYGYNSLPSSRKRVRRFSDSSVEGFFN